ncbi:MAG: CvpA family protein [Hyphomicrobiales bacterium]
MTITILDGIVLAVVLLSAVLAMMRGFLREVLSIGSWIAAAAGAYFLYPTFLPFAQQYITEEVFATAAVIGVLFFLVLIIVSYLTMKLSDVVADSAIGPLDRTLGFLFGAARGVLLFVIATLFFNFFIPENPPQWVADSRSKPILDELGADLLAILPDDPEGQIIDRIRGTDEEEEGGPDADIQSTAPSSTAPSDIVRDRLAVLIDQSSSN